MVDSHLHSQCVYLCRSSLSRGDETSDRFRGKMPPRGAEAEQGEAGELTDAPQFWPEREGGCISDSVQLCE